MKSKWETFVFAWFGNTSNLAKAMNISFSQAKRWHEQPMTMHVCDISKIATYTKVNIKDVVNTILESEQRTIKHEGDE